MVSAVSGSASTILSSSSSSDIATLEAQLAEKRAALAKTQDKDEKATVEKAIETLEAKIAKLSTSSETTAAQPAAASNSRQAAAPAQMSGESERIGDTNFDESTEFGDRTAYV
jgi:phosphate uptake regulator